MSRLAPDRLSLVRRLYEDSELTIAEIALLADVSESAIYQRARREQWVNTRRPGVTPRKQKLRPPLPATPALMALAGQSGTVEPDGAPAEETLTPTLSRTPERESDGDAAFPDVDRAETARRLWLAVDRHLAGLDAQGAPDNMVRAAQNFATLARTLETLIDVEQALVDERPDGARYPDEGPEDIDEFRNEIAERLERLLAGKPAEAIVAGTAGEDASAAGGVDRAGIARRLWLAVNRHLADLDVHGAPDNMVRAAQNFATLARTLETLVDVERSLADERPDGARYPDEGPANIDEFCAEITRRLEGLHGKPPHPDDLQTENGADRGAPRAHL